MPDNPRADQLSASDHSTSEAARDRLPAGKMPGLDSLRGAAIAGVVLYHGIGGATPPATVTGWKAVVASASLEGAWGVQLFFVLSGFLITGILLDTKSHTHYYWNFYIRRALRIVPAYLMTLTLLKAGGYISWGYLGLSLLYFSNMPSLFHRGPEYGPLWSLSVEEQFYLVWPLLLRRLDVRRLTIVCLLLVSLSPLLRLVVLSFPSPLHDVRGKTPLITDTFAMGALLAIAIRSKRWTVDRLTRLGWALVGGGIIVGAADAFASARPGFADYAPAVASCPYILGFGGVILLAVLHPGFFRSAAGGALAFLGAISYGLYLIHQFVMILYDKATAGTWLGDVQHDGAAFLLRPAICIAISIALATLSRFTVEERFLRLKGVLASK
ncbi:MAG TPA: acyltransferase [Polyangiaceae bacterium]|jgi:peptidoglycan/LPS O-acetylase OafA/YrhL|nr:acyltransferase [Polyangiaceae bacterium]